jgi:hypothetical protein
MIPAELQISSYKKYMNYVPKLQLQKKGTQSKFLKKLSTLLIVFMMHCISELVIYVDSTVLLNMQVHTEVRYG